jgi:hypothetical protein
MLGSLAGGALLVGAAAPAPAAAKGFGDDIEEILIGAAVLAGVVAVAAGVLKDKVEDWESERRTSGGALGSDRTRALEDCTQRAEREAERYGRYPRVVEVDVDRDGAEYRVKGEVEVERDTGWDGDPSEYDRAGFTCSARSGQVTAFRFTDGFRYAARSQPAKLMPTLETVAADLRP